MEQIERIRQMEAALDGASAALKALEDALDGYSAARKDLGILAAYYDGGDWRQDFEDDEAGRLPKDLKRGVLSEDALYDLLTDDRRLLIRMLETAADALRQG